MPGIDMLAMNMLGMNMPKPFNSGREILEPSSGVGSLKKGKFSPFHRTDDLCRYCMHQKLKLTDGKIVSISGYCPTDLFSGDERCMEFALAALFENPQNNLKVFLDGVPVFNEQTHSRDLSFLRDCDFLKCPDADWRKKELISVIVKVRLEMRIS